MTVQTASFTTAQIGDLRRALNEISFRLAQTGGNPDVAPAAIQVKTDTAGTLQFVIAATQSSAAYTVTVGASVA